SLFVMTCRPPTPTLFPYTTLFRSITLPSTPGQGARQAAREMLSDIIHQRLDEIFHMVDREFEKAGYGGGRLPAGVVLTGGTAHLDRKSTRLNSSHLVISYAVFCLK